MSTVINFLVTFLRSLRKSEVLWRAGMLGVAFLFIVTGAAIVDLLTNLGLEAKKVSRTHYTLTLLEDLLGSAKDQEIGQRGYLITQDPSFLPPKQKSDREIPEIISQLKRLVAENPESLKEVEALEVLVAQRVVEIDYVLRVAKDQSFEAAVHRMKSGIGKALMDDIRNKIEAIELTESRALQDRLDSFEGTRIQGKYASAVTILAVLILTLTTVYLDRLFQKNRDFVEKESTSRKAAEEALQHSQSRLRTALMHLPLRLYSLDLNGKYIWLHDSNNQFKLEEVIGKTDADLFGSEYVEELSKLQEEAIASNKAVHKILKLPYFNKNVSYDVTIEPDRNPYGDVIGVTVSAFDIQHQIDLQHAIEQRAQDLRVIADTMPQMVWASDPHGNIDYFNLRWYEYTGDPQNGSKLSSHMRYTHPDDFLNAQDSWFHSLKSGEPFAAEYRIRNGTTGEDRWFVVRALPIKDRNGTIVRWFGTCTDVHDQKLHANQREAFLESERAARAQIERVMASKEAAVATLSHELRGPINAIVGWTQLLRAKKDNPDQKLVSRAIDVIEQNARSQAQLVQDLFEMQVINSGKLVLEMSKLNLSKIVEAAADSIIPACEEKGLKLIKDIDANIIDVPGEGRRIAQVVTNLLNNSLKFTPRAGTINISLKRIGEEAVITVKDNGIGIEEESLQLIFDRYNQGAIGDNTARGQGLGLGLTIARSIIKLHAGKIEARSEGKDKGSIFTIYLPLSRADIQIPHSEVTSESKSTSDNLLQNLKILLVEDQDDSREALFRILSSQGAEVNALASGDAALQWMRSNSPQVIISDISMPEMDGYMLIKEIRRRHGPIPAIALTAFTRAEDKQRALEAGFQRHLPKPPDIALLIYAIKNILPTI